jgi:flagellar basal body-associated protein FliL
MLPVVLLYFGEWGLIIPIIVVGIVILLLSGAGEGVKTALATIILLLYIFGALGYFLFTTFFVSAVKEQVVETGVSPSGTYRYRVVNTEDTSNGSTAVYVEPNYADVKNDFAVFTLKNQEHVVYMERPVQSKVEIKWDTKTRQEITDYLNSISDEIEVTLTDAELKALGYTYDNKLMLTTLSASRKFALGLTASDVDPVPIDTLTPEQLDFFGIGKEPDGRYYILDPDPSVVEKNGSEPGARIYFDEIKPKALKLYNSLNVDPPTGITYFKVAKSHTVLLNTLTDAQLADLGVSDSGDVMILSASQMVVPEEDKDKEDAEATEEIVTSDNKVVFRYYVAELEDYYDVDSRRLSLDLLN